MYLSYPVSIAEVVKTGMTATHVEESVFYQKHTRAIFEIVFCISCVPFQMFEGHVFPGIGAR